MDAVLREEAMLETRDVLVVFLFREFPIELLVLNLPRLELMEDAVLLVDLVEGWCKLDFLAVVAVVVDVVVDIVDVVVDVFVELIRGNFIEIFNFSSRKLNLELSDVFVLLCGVETEGKFKSSDVFLTSRVSRMFCWLRVS